VPIWKGEWDEMVAGRYRNIGRWKHEEPLELESESEVYLEVEDKAPVFSSPKREPRRPKSDEEIRQIAERERERDASRPVYHFVYQVSKERERIQDESRVDGVILDSADINIWTKRGITMEQEMGRHRRPIYWHFAAFQPPESGIQDQSTCRHLREPRRQ
jgi:hypothetical protein